MGQDPNPDQRVCMCVEWIVRLSGVFYNLIDFEK